MSEYNLRLRSVLWRLLKPVLVALIVAFLTALGVSVEVGRQSREALLSAAGTTHFSALSVVGDAAVGGDLTVVGSASYTSASVAVPFVDTSGSLRVEDSALITGTLAVQGPVSDIGTTFMVNDNSLVTGTLGVSSQINAGNGVAVTGLVTTTGASSAASYTATGAGTFGGALSVGTLFGVGMPDAAAVITVTNNMTITPVYTFQKLTAAGAVYTQIMTAGTAGRIVFLENVGSNAITITDTGTIMLSATMAIGQYDILGLVSDGTNWIEIFRANN